MQNEREGTQGISAPLVTRYKDAYRVGQTIVRLGDTVKMIGIVGAVLLAFLGLLAGGKLGVTVALGAFLLGAIVALVFFVLGTLQAAQGQMLLATLDGAVNSSPFLSRNEMLEILVPSDGTQDAVNSSKDRKVRVCPECDTENPVDRSDCQKCGVFITSVPFSLPRTDR